MSLVSLCRFVKTPREGRIGSLIVAGMMTAASAGCGGAKDSKLIQVSGAVTLDGAPLPKGAIVLDPADGKGRSFASEIVDGKFRVPAEPGKKKVSITATRETDRKDEYGGAVLESIVPRRYNAQTTLQADVPSTAPPPLTFDLTTKPR